MVVLSLVKLIVGGHSHIFGMIQRLSVIQIIVNTVLVAFSLQFLSFKILYLLFESFYNFLTEVRSLCQFFFYLLVNVNVTLK